MGNTTSKSSSLDTIRNVFQAQGDAPSGYCCCKCSNCTCNSKDQSKQSATIMVYGSNQTAGDKRAH